MSARCTQRAAASPRDHVMTVVLTPRRVSRMRKLSQNALSAYLHTCVDVLEQLISHNVGLGHKHPTFCRFLPRLRQTSFAKALNVLLPRTFLCLVGRAEDQDFTRRIGLTFNFIVLQVSRNVLSPPPRFACKLSYSLPTL